MKDILITEKEIVEKGDLRTESGTTFPGVPEHIRIRAEAKPEAGSRIRIELWMPTADWNGDLAGIGNGGAAGSIPCFALAGPLCLGFAVVTTDMGTSAGPDCGIGNEAVWRDFGYRATHVMTEFAKEQVEHYYGKTAKHAYFVGGSTGGQQALSEAQRFPEDYDGILACAPAYDRIALHLAFLWDWQHLNASGVDAITPEQEIRIRNALLEKYAELGDRRPGDDFFYWPNHIRVQREDLMGLGLTDPQIHALLAVYRGAQDIYEPTLTPGSEASGLGIAHRCEKERFAHDYFYLFRWVLGKDFDFEKFDFARDGNKVREALVPVLDASNPDLTAFRRRGGKLLLIHGTADPIIPMSSSIRYFEDVQRKMGNTADFFRLFLAPGMGHITGGPGVQDIVFGFPATPKDEKHLGLLALKAWVQENKAPDNLFPVAFKKDQPLSAFMPDGTSWEREIQPYGADRETADTSV